MIYTINYCSESGSFSHSPTDVDHVQSLAKAKSMLKYWGYQHEQVGTDKNYAYLYIFKGLYDDTTDIYPDKIARFGKRGGINISNC